MIIEEPIMEMERKMSEANREALERRRASTGQQCSQSFWRVITPPNAATRLWAWQFSQGGRLWAWQFSQGGKLHKILL